MELATKHYVDRELNGIESTDTTYTFANGTEGNFTVTPEGGTAQTVSIGKPATAGAADKATAANLTTTENAIAKYSNTTGSFANSGVTIDGNNNIVTSGKLTVGTNPTADMDVATKQYVDNKIFYGTTSTASTTITKIVTCNGYVLNKGNMISVRFSAASTATTMSLNVNSTGAKNVYYNNSTAIPSDLIQIYDTVTFIYDGSYYRLIAIDRQDAKAYYGTTATAAATAAKVVTCTNYFLRKGNIISVRFGSYANTATTMSLNVNSTGAKNVYYNNSTTIPSDLIQLNDTVTFIYDGSYYRLISVDPINTSNIIYSVTAADTAAKIGIAKVFTLQPGFFQVLILNSNTYDGAITLNIKNTGAKPIYINEQPSSSTNKTLPAGYYLVYYDGSRYYFNTEDNFYANKISTPRVTFHKDTADSIASIFKGASNDLMIRNTFDTDGSITIISDFNNINLIAHTKNSFSIIDNNNESESEIAFINNNGLYFNEGKDIYFKSASEDTYNIDAGGIFWFKADGTTRKATLRVPNLEDIAHNYPAPTYRSNYHNGTGERHLGLTNAFFAKASGTSQTRNSLVGYDITLYNNIKGSGFCFDHPVQPGDIISVYFPTATTTSIVALHIAQKPFGAPSSVTTTYQSLRMYKGAMAAIGAITAGKTITFIAMWAIQNSEGGIGSQTPELCLYKIAEC